MDYSYLLASDGTGDAPLMHVTGTRIVGATTLAVSTVTGVPAKFIATSGTLAANGLLDPATVTNFKGHVSGGALEIESFEPGSTDLGNVVDQVVVIKPNTSWANDIVDLARVSHNNDGSIKTELLSALWPVGAIYSSTVSTNPATSLGFGTWVAFGQGRVMVGKAASGTFGTPGATGGEETHVLSTAEMPQHNHSVNPVPLSRADVDRGGGSSLFSLDDSTTINTSNTGSGSAHNNLQPYVVVYMWTRTV